MQLCFELRALGPSRKKIIALLSLIPSSHMVAPIRDLGNNSFSFSSNIHSQQDFQLPTVFSMNCIGMDSLFSGSFPDNFDDIRGRTPTSKLQVSRDLSLSSTKSLVAYHKRMEGNNAMNIDDVSSALSYEMT